LFVFDNNKRFDYNKNRQNLTKIGGNNKFLFPVLLLVNLTFKLVKKLSSFFQPPTVLLKLNETIIMIIFEIIISKNTRD